MSFYLGSAHIKLVVVESCDAGWYLSAKDAVNNIYVHDHLFTNLKKANKTAMKIIDDHIDLSLAHWRFSHTEYGKSY